MLFISTFIKKRLVRVRRFASQWECGKEQTSPLSLLRQSSISKQLSFHFHVFDLLANYLSLSLRVQQVSSRTGTRSGTSLGPATCAVSCTGPRAQKDSVRNLLLCFSPRETLIISEQQTLCLHLSLGCKLWSQSCPGHPPTFHLCSIHPACFVGTL